MGVPTTPKLTHQLDPNSSHLGFKTLNVREILNFQLSSDTTVTQVLQISNFHRY